MAETTDTQTTTQETKPTFFGNSSWSETPPVAAPTEQVVEGGNQTTQTEPAAATTTTEPVIENQVAIPVEWLKKEFDIEDPTVLKAEREELKRLKETPPTPTEIKFENDQSKHIHELIREGKTKEVRQFLETQEKLDSYTSLEVTADTAADIIKLGMQIKFKDLSPKEIEYKFNKEFGIPPAPVQKADELEEEFADRQAAWKEKVEDVQMLRSIEAKLAKPELEKAKTQLILPEISKPTVQANEPSPEEQEKIKKMAENYVAKIESDYSKADGFKTKVKDESVQLEFPVEFKIPDEDKVAIKGRLQSGFDINGYMDKRWFDDQNNPKVEQIISDLYQLENLDKILSGVANNSANERLKEYRKQTSNVSVNGNGGFQQTFQQGQNGDIKATPFGKNAWSEKPPTSVNN